MTVQDTPGQCFDNPPVRSSSYAEVCSESAVCPKMLHVCCGTCPPRSYSLILKSVMGSHCQHFSLNSLLERQYGCEKVAPTSNVSCSTRLHSAIATHSACYSIPFGRTAQFRHESNLFPNVHCFAPCWDSFLCLCDNQPSLKWRIPLRWGDGYLSQGDEAGASVARCAAFVKPCAEQPVGFGLIDLLGK